MVQRVELRWRSFVDRVVDGELQSADDGIRGRLDGDCHFWYLQGAENATDRSAMSVWMIALAVLSLSAQANGSPQPFGALADTTRAPGPTPVITATCDGNVKYCPSPDQVRVDLSISEIAIDSAFSSHRFTLTEDWQDDCEILDGCDWLDSNKVRHYMWGESPEELFVVLKMIEAKDFVGRSIPAFGIGTARKQTDVMANVRRFLPDVEIDCDHVSGSVGPVECGGTLNPGWFQIGFDVEGNLLAIRFDGYQFT